MLRGSIEEIKKEQINFWDRQAGFLATFFKKLTVLTPDTHTYQGVRNVSLSEDFVYALNESSLG